MYHRKIYVCAPEGHVSGGPELLHQFVDCMRRNGADASMLYVPFEKSCSVPDAYSAYNIAVSWYTDTDFSESVVVLPELYTRYAGAFPGAEVFIWWLSVDNYLGKCTGRSALREKVKHAVNLIKRKKLSMRRLRQYKHLAQSEYARLFISRHGMTSAPLTDYLNAVHLDGRIDTQRDNIIAYNPKKGSDITQRLIAHMPGVRFVPIRDMTFQQVRDLLQHSKIYIDFGGHPGKDRFPREAAMAGCCIITGMQGSAGNPIDVPIPAEYKIAEQTPDFVECVEARIADIFEHFSERQADFAAYRDAICHEPALFEQQVVAFLNTHCR